MAKTGDTLAAGIGQKLPASAAGDLLTQHLVQQQALRDQGVSPKLTQGQPPQGDAAMRQLLGGLIGVRGKYWTH